MMLRCDGCGDDLGEVMVRSFAEVSGPGGERLINLTCTAPEVRALAERQPDGSMPLLCMGCRGEVEQSAAQAVQGALAARKAARGR